MRVQIINSVASSATFLSLLWRFDIVLSLVPIFHPVLQSNRQLTTSFTPFHRRNRIPQLRALDKNENEPIRLVSLFRNTCDPSTQRMTKEQFKSLPMIADMLVRIFSHFLLLLIYSICLSKKRHRGRILSKKL